ncbi:MAG: hypothetical protein AAGB31_11955 [Bdellovibrio sp.]
MGDSHDFFKVVTDSVPESDKNWQRPTDCRENIKTILCEVNPSEERFNPLKRPCLGGEEKYATVFEAVYDSMDDVNKNMFCSLRRIFIERNFYATGYASIIHHQMGDNEELNILPGAVLGVRKSILEATPSHLNWLSWKEQKNFVQIDEEFLVPLQYPVFESTNPVKLLEDVVAHEFGHLFDFANKINDEQVGDESCYEKDETKEDYDYYRECKPFMPSGTWGAISWKDSRTVLPEKEVVGYRKLCFYDCKDHMTSTEMVAFYRGLADSDFVSSYALSNPTEDFAESWARRWMLNSGKNLSVKVSADFTYSIKDIYNSKKFEAKRQYIKKFLQGEILYP